MGEEYLEDYGVTCRKSHIVTMARAKAVCSDIADQDVLMQSSVQSA